MSARATLRGLRAGPELDGELRRFTSAIGTGQGLRIALDRTPSFFEALEVEGEDPFVAAFAREADNGEPPRIVGTGVMTERYAYVNGSSVPIRIGQLGSARIDPEFRGGLLFARCFKLLREWHQTRAVRVFLTTVLEDNIDARKLFESGRAGIPTYRDLGRFVTLNQAVGPREPAGENAVPGVEVTAAGVEDVERIIEFWRLHGPRRQFFPAYTAEQLRGDRGVLRGLRVEDMLIARSSNDAEILGVLGVWDQSAYRRWVIQGMPRKLVCLAPAWNLLARLTGKLRLPRSGQALVQRFVTGMCIVDDDAQVFRALVAAARRKLAGRGGAWLTFGFHEQDPLLRVARERGSRELHSRLYLAHWPEGGATADRLVNDRYPYLEVGGI